jgi:hypothetical protein
MRVDTAMLGVVFSALGTLVVVIGALAAVRQLAHLRRGNELSAIGKFVDEWSSQSFEEDRVLVRKELAGMLADPAFFETFRDDPRTTRVFRVCHFFERLAFFVRQGAISELLAMELFATAAIMQWDLLRDFIVGVRAHHHTQTPMEWFEDFAMRAPEWAERNNRRSKGLRRDPKAPFLRAEPAAPPPAARVDEGLAAPET